MSPRVFFAQLFAVSGLTVAGLYFLHRLPVLQSYAGLSWAALLFFVGLSIAMFYIGRQAAASKNKHNFTNTVMGFTIAKMMIAAFIIVGYLKLFQPATKLFILPFFGIYVIYTIFEISFMTRLGRTN